MQWIHNIIRWNHFGKLQSIYILTKNLKINLTSLRVFVSLLTMIRKTCCLLCFLIVLIGLPMYLTLKSQYATHQYQYGWFFSAAFMSGVLPSILLIALYLVLNCAVGYSFVKLYPSHASDSSFRESLKAIEPNIDSFLISNLTLPLNPLKSSSKEDPKSLIFCSRKTSHRFSQFVIYLTVILANILFFLSANSLYVFLLLSGSGYFWKIMSKVGISLFTLLWNMFILPSYLEYSAQSIGDIWSQYKWILIFLLLFNNIVVPGLATAVSDSSCFDDLFLHDDKIVAYYSYIFCEIYTIHPFQSQSECSAYSTSGLSTTYHPPFFYNFSCASSILENYIPVFFITYGILSLVPLIAFFFLHSPLNLFEFLPAWCLESIPYLWRSPASYPYQIQYDANKIFKPNRIICNVFAHLSVLLTFGMASPMLAVAITMTVCGDISSIDSQSTTANTQIQVGYLKTLPVGLTLHAVIFYLVWRHLYGQS
jgi:hypothetical protein